MHSLLQASQSGLQQVNGKLAKFTIAVSCAALLASCATSEQAPVDVEIREVLPQSAGNETLPDGQASVLDDAPVLVATDVDAENTARQVSQAEYYQRQAQTQSDSVAQVEATLSSAEYFVQANEYQQAAGLVNSVRHLITTEEHLNRAIIVLAYAEYADGNYQAALTRLAPLTRSATLQDADTDTGTLQETPLDEGQADPEGLEDDSQPRQREYIDANKTLNKEGPLTTQQVDALLLSSFCHQALGDAENAIATLIRRESALYGAARAETTRYLWQVINTVPQSERELLAQQSLNPKVRNRVQQSLRGEIGDSVEAPQQFTQWREEPSAAAPTSVIDNQWGVDSPRSVFVLLPLSSRFNKAAQAVKAGIEREHGLNNSPYRPDLRYYDVGNNPLQIGQYYAAAVRAGADFIIGPIGKSFSNEANTSRSYFGTSGSGYSSRVPLLMLGGDQPLAADSLRISMSPEMEGRRVAERAWKDGHLSAGVLLANDQESQRVLSGFNERWLSLGGKLSKTIQYSPQQYDHSVELKQLFDINQSEYRHRQLSQALGFKPKFSPYQRADIDFIFMVAKSQTGRIVRPQINFFTNSQMPVYATSALYNGIEDPINNIDLDNTLFPIMPWVIRSSNVAQYAGQLNMLHAMGMDAYRVASSISTLRGQSDTAINGNMGQLQLQSNGEIIYQPMWAKFEKGALTVDDSRGLDITPIGVEPSEDGTFNPSVGPDGRPSQPSRGSYNDNNWDSGESRRKTGG